MLLGVVLSISGPTETERKECCDKGFNDGESHGDSGGWVCCKGVAVPCNWWNNSLAYGNIVRTPGQARADEQINFCINSHESKHRSDVNSAQCEDPDKAKSGDGTRVGWNNAKFPTNKGAAQRENDLMAMEKNCNNKAGHCDADKSGNALSPGDQKDCVDAIVQRNTDLQNAIDKNNRDYP